MGVHINRHNSSRNTFGANIGSLWAFLRCILSKKKPLQRFIYLQRGLGYSPVCRLRSSSLQGGNGHLSQSSFKQGGCQSCLSMARCTAKAIPLRANTRKSRISVIFSISSDICWSRNQRDFRKRHRAISCRHQQRCNSRSF